MSDSELSHCTSTRGRR